MGKRDIFYVYALQDSRTGAAFYVGKGSKNRAYEHTTDWNLRNDGNRYKVNKINKIRREGGEVEVRIVADNMSEKKAFEMEEDLISELGIENLTNMTHGGEGESLSEEMKANLREFHLGKTLSEETKQRMSESKSGIAVVKGEEVGGAILTKQEASEVLWLTEETMYRFADIGILFGVSKGVVQHIANRESWKHIGPKKPSQEILDVLEGSPKAGGVRSPNLDKKVAAGIKWLVINTNLTEKEISEIYNVEKITVNQIKNGYSHPSVTPSVPPGYNPWSMVFFPEIDFYAVQIVSISPTRQHNPRYRRRRASAVINRGRLSGFDIAG